jgi:2-oxoglutarate dehydrogenase E1 component
MHQFPDYAQFSNVSLLEEYYAKYCVDPLSVDLSWRHFFQGVDFSNSICAPVSDQLSRIHDLMYAYRRYGHLLVETSPLRIIEPQVTELTLETLGFKPTDLELLFPSCGLCPQEQAPLKEIIAALKHVYSTRIGFEYMDLEDPVAKKWFQEKIEPKLIIDLSHEEKKLILELLGKSEMFETFIHTKFVGQKRFSLEGGETLIPILSEIIDQGSKLGISDFVIGMAHRGRLNVLANILHKPYSVIFQEFEDNVLPLLLEGNGDVKYHKGFTAQTHSRSHLPVTLHLAANSSCLEAVDPVVLGQTRAKQDVQTTQKVASILIHGDASFAGQGVVYESLQLMNLPGYTTGGTIHIVINNQVGFTTLPEEGRSTRYCTDIAKTFGCPVFHVNAEDPESCLFAAKLAVEFRLKFKKDVFIDLNCYRKYGHNEGDEPSFTQPLQYQIIRAKKSIRTLYLEGLTSQDASIQKTVEELDQVFRTVLNAALDRGRKEDPHAPAERYGAYTSVPSSATLLEAVDTKIDQKTLTRVALALTQVPTGFHPHPKLQKLIHERAAMMTDKVDWAMAELLAFGSLLIQEIPLRLTGQDCRRGTFSQRHAVWTDVENATLYFPLASLGNLAIYNSPLSEFACLAYEYGYTWSSPESSVLWEAQFGDFSIGAQTVIDHFISTAEQKWARYSGITLLLPHGYEGQGPEHSSGRMERFLQLAANNNMQIVDATTPAQYFHLLRRQALRPIKKPLIVFTPKSLLRLPACSSSISQFTSGQFEEVLDDPIPPKLSKQILLCSGKVFYDLLVERANRKRDDVAILRIEQLYPVHEEKLAALLLRYKECADIRWVQEEPRNMGAWEFIASYLPNQTRYVGRVRSGVTASGSFNQHKQELDQFMKEAFE